MYEKRIAEKSVNNGRNSRKYFDVGLYDFRDEISSFRIFRKKNRSSESRGHGYQKTPKQNHQRRNYRRKYRLCGAGISTGMFISVISQSTPFTNLPLSLSNLMTSEALKSIGTVGGPRCCKRNSYLAIIAATRFVKEHTGIETELPEIVCTRSAKNNRCIGNRCPFFKSRLNNP